MRILRKIKKLGNLLIGQEDDGPSPPNDRHRMRDGAPPPPPPNINYGPLPRSFFSAVNLAREDAGYDALPVFPRGPIPTGEENHVYEYPKAEFPAFERSRSKSRERSLDRSARHRSRGTPVKFRRQPISPELLQPSASSPFLFRQHSLPSSPEMHRRFQPAQQFQHIPGQQQQQFDMMMGQPVQFFPQFQQPFYPMIHPNLNMQPWFMMRQPPMYPFF
jgi:hypothetical protein